MLPGDADTANGKTGLPVIGMDESGEWRSLAPKSAVVVVSTSLSFTRFRNECAVEFSSSSALHLAAYSVPASAVRCKSESNLTKHLEESGYIF